MPQNLLVDLDAAPGARLEIGDGGTTGTNYASHKRFWAFDVLGEAHDRRYPKTAFTELCPTLL